MSDVDLDRLRAWSYRRQGLDRPVRDLLETLDDAVAVYSSQPTAPLSLVARCRVSDPAEFNRLEQERQAIRLPAMRGSVFLMSTGTAPTLLSATRVPLEKLQRRLEYGGLTWDDYARIKQQFLATATSPMTSSELQDAIPVEGKLMVAIRLLAYEGLALRVGEGLRSDSFRYVSSVSWLGAPLDEPGPDESLAWLAGTYLRAFGPARVVDFAWWAGVTKGKARKAIGSVQSLDVGDGILLHADDVDAWESCEPLSGDEVALLPKWDPYTMGYQSDGRSRFVRDEHHELAYPKIRATSGDGAPLVLRGGEAVATWAHRFQGDRMTVSASPFQAGDRRDWLSESSFEAVAAVLGATDLTLTVDPG